MLRALNVLLPYTHKHTRIHCISTLTKELILIHPYIDLYQLSLKHMQCVSLLFKLTTNKKCYYFNNTINVAHH